MTNQQTCPRENNRTFKPIVATILSLYWSLGQAAPITFSFIGEIGQMTEGLSGFLSVGDTVGGHYTFDDDTAGSQTTFGSPTFAQSLNFAAAVSDSTIQINGWRLGSSGAGSISYHQGYGTEYDYYNVTVPFGQGDVGGFTPVEMYLVADGYHADFSDVFASNRLSVNPPPLSDLDYLLQVSFAGSEYFTANITMISSEPALTEVPLPSSVWLLGTCLAGLLSVLMKHKKR